MASRVLHDGQLRWCVSVSADSVLVKADVDVAIAWFFIAVGSYMMGVWAIKKHRNYKKEFGKEYPKRNIMIPFIW